MTCKELGGPCDQKLSAGSWDEMVQTMVTHVMSKPPGNGRGNEDDARARSQEVGQRDEAEMGCGSRSLGAAARFGSRLIACAAVFGLYQGTSLDIDVPLGNGA